VSAVSEGLTSLKFWKRTGERSVKTAAQTLAATLATGATGLLDVDWASALSVAGLAAVLSVVTSVASAPVGDDPQNPSLV
jgi:hypothetical protein